jgi:hypothetical protein
MTKSHLDSVWDYVDSVKDVLDLIMVNADFKERGKSKRPNLAIRAFDLGPCYNPRAMFERLRQARKLLTADKTAAHITNLLRPCMFLVLQAGGSIDPKLMSDEFVVAYLYGGIAVCLEALGVSDTAETGYAIQQVFERLFPNNGRSVTEGCNQRARQKDPGFMQASRLGYMEMIEVFNSEGQKIPHSLLDHIRKNYVG